ncbi:GPN-loop GTPase 2 [Pseudolycoriella hygida]|uniref:GPN-loop GTPase 2 n=1 Tax=Pseudolycoriella hygida TaxID=35572 RepID=A0A9Q0RUZ2_9DIPT|nr:GPN-loop GTPase 2 [Pseudolycoriella hygida]
MLASNRTVVPNLKYSKPLYAQLVIGPPGSGKTTYCHNMNEFLKKLDRKTTIVNLDPANEQMMYEPSIDIMKLVTVEDVMEHYHLGPNGALMYCMELLEQNFDWLLEQLKSSPFNYFLFDCPGQVELYTHHRSMANIFSKLESLGYHLCTVHLIDSHYCSEPAKFISTLMLSLNTMLQMELPHVNVLSKADLLKQYESKLHFNLDFYMDVLDLGNLLQLLDDEPGMKKYAKLNAAIVSMIEDYSLVSFQPLDCSSDDSLLRLKNVIDKTNGYVYGAAEEKSINTLLACAVGAETQNERSKKDVDPYV